MPCRSRRCALRLGRTATCVWPRRGGADVLMERTAGSECLTSARFAGMNREAAPFAFLLAGDTFGVRGRSSPSTPSMAGPPSPSARNWACSRTRRFIVTRLGGCVGPAIAAEVAAVIARGLARSSLSGAARASSTSAFPAAAASTCISRSTPTPRCSARRCSGSRAAALQPPVRQGRRRAHPCRRARPRHRPCRQPVPAPLSAAHPRAAGRPRRRSRGHGAGGAGGEFDVALATPSENGRVLADLGVPVTLLHAQRAMGPADRSVDGHGAALPRA